MYKIRYAEDSDKGYWFNIDNSIDELTFEKKVLYRMAYVFEDRSTKIGILRYSLFGDNIPFCNYLFINELFRHKGCGKALIRFWEQDMKSRGYSLALVSSYIDEEINSFYRKMGYRETGGIVIHDKRNDNRMEILMIKRLYLIRSGWFYTGRGVNFFEKIRILRCF